MKKGTKVMAALVAVSLLAPTQAWAASNPNHEQAKEKWKAEQKLLLPEAWKLGTKQSQVLSTLQSDQLNTKIKAPAKLQADKPLLQQLDGKKKSVSVKSVPKEMEKALDNVYKVFPELKDLKLTGAEILFETDDRPELWGFDFRSGNKKDEKVKRASVALIAKDEIIVDYFNYDYNKKPGKAPTEKVAKEKATAFLKKVLGSKASKYVISSVDIYGEEDEEDDEILGEADVDFLRTINSIPFEQRGINLSLDGDGKITRYYCNYETLMLDDSDFPDPKDAIKTSEVKSKYLKLEEMTLAYNSEEIVEYNQKTEKFNTKPVLKYMPSYYGPMNAITGEKVTMIDHKDEDATKPEIVKLQPEGKVLTASNRAEAESMLKEQFKIDVTGWDFDQYPDEDDEDEDEDEGRSDYLHYNWYIWDEDQDQEVYLTINKTTNQVLSFSHDIYEGRDKEDKLISEEAAKEIALDTFQKYAKTSMNEAQLSVARAPLDENDLPSWVNEEELPDYWNEDTYVFFLYELYQGVPIQDSRYGVVVDGNTGAVREVVFANTSKQLNLPDNKDTVSTSKAATAFGSNLMFEKVYTWPQFFGQKAPEPLLIYVANPQYEGYIDAFTGKFVRVKVTK